MSIEQGWHMMSWQTILFHSPSCPTYFICSIMLANWCSKCSFTVNSANQMRNNDLFPFRKAVKIRLWSPPGQEHFSKLITPVQCDITLCPHWNSEADPWPFKDHLLYVNVVSCEKQPTWQDFIIYLIMQRGDCCSGSREVRPLVTAFVIRSPASLSKGTGLNTKLSHCSKWQLHHHFIKLKHIYHVVWICAWFK